MYEKILMLAEKGKHPKPLSDAVIGKVSAFCEEQLGCPLPADYADFLRRSNGLAAPGGAAVFCCYTNDIRDNFPDYAYSDFATLNLEFRDMTDIDEYLLLGRSSVDYLCYEKATGKYQVRSNGVMRVIAEGDHLSDVIGEFFGI
jgi:hypothetical protein